ncbi:MAG: hypothetical protein FJ221_18225 [Lentisphaerae bacterium]|nr:hypothetical protein [Lentisphaerota bacterium]
MNANGEHPDERIGRSRAGCWAGWLLGLVALGAAGCAQVDAAHARFMEPPYVVTRHFFEEAPQRVAVLPFATRTGMRADDRKAEACRRVFYQHMCLRDFEDVELRRCDVSVFQSAVPARRESMVRQMIDVVRALDVVGMTTFIDLDDLFSERALDGRPYAEMIRRVRDDTNADAYIMGITRDFGRLYAVVFSTIGISTRVEMRSMQTGRLLWRGEERERSYELPLTLNPLDVPRLLYDVWQHSRGQAMDSLAYRVYGDICHSLPYVPTNACVRVQGRREDAPYYRKPGLWFVFAEGRMKPGEQFEFRMEEDGWFHCTTPDGRPVWIFRRHARLTDAAGQAITPYADLDW